MSRSDGANLLEARELVKSFGGGWSGPRRAVLCGASVRVRAGEVVAIAGANGAGKSTLLRICANLLLPDSGVLRIAGSASSPASRMLVGFSSGDERSFFLRLTARTNLRFYARLFGVPSKLAASRIDELSQRLRIESWMDRPMAETSAGIRARFGLARALLHAPQLLLLDEPSKSQDQEGRELICEVIREHANRGRATLLVSHDEAVIHALEAKRMVMSEGLLLERHADLPAT